MYGKLLYVVVLIVVTAVGLALTNAATSPNIKDECKKTDLTVMVRGIKTSVYDCGKEKED